LRIDLDGSGEIVRLGDRRQLMEGGFKSYNKDKKNNNWDLVNNSFRRSSTGSNNNQNEMIINSNNKNSNTDNINDTIPDDSMSCLLLPCNVEIRSYLLDANAEISSKQLISRCLPIHVSKTTYDPNADLVLNDLHSIPTVIDAIDKGMIYD